MASSYSVVAFEYREALEEQIKRGSPGKVFFFNDDNAVDSCEGRVEKLIEVEGKGLMVIMHAGTEIPADRIITLFGKPGAAFDEYDSFANQCLSCTGGYEL